MITLFAILSLAAVTPASERGASPHQAAAGCSSEITKVRGGGAVDVTPLGALPDAHLEIAVNRITADGCPAPFIVRYSVSR